MSNWSTPMINDLIVFVPHRRRRLLRLIIVQFPQIISRSIMNGEEEETEKRKSRETFHFVIILGCANGNFAISQLTRFGCEDAQIVGGNSIKIMNFCDVKNSVFWFLENIFVDQDNSPPPWSAYAPNNCTAIEFLLQEATRKRSFINRNLNF